MGDENKLDDSELEKQLNMMCMYEAFDDCRHLMEDVFDYARQNKVRYFHVEVALEIAHGEFLDRQRVMKRGQGYSDRLRQLKVDALTSARTYVEDMVTGKRSR